MRTQAHRDAIDFKSCLVLTFGEFEGAELCLFEPRLVFELKHGDFVVFSSEKITHYNLDFSGVWGSLVLHLDVALAQALTDPTKRGWINNVVKEKQASGYCPPEEFVALLLQRSQCPFA